MLSCSETPRRQVLLLVLCFVEVYTYVIDPVFVQQQYNTAQDSAVKQSAEIIRATVS
jgi:hypothetical protein